MKKSIKEQVAISSFWVIVGRACTSLTAFIVFAVLARFLGPRDFGLVAFASIFVEFTGVIALSGLPQALVQRTDWDEEVSSTAFWTNLAIAFLLATLMGPVFGLIMARYYDPSFAWVMPLLAITLVTDALRASHEAKLQRSFAYRQLANRTIVATILGGVVGVAMAYAGFGMAALVASRLASSISQTTVTWLTVRWVPKRTFAKQHFGPLLRFGVHLAGANIFSNLSVRTPELVIGFFLGPASVGTYRIGSRVVNMIRDSVIRPLNSSSLSAFSRVRESGSIAQAYCRITKVTALVSCPIYFGLAAIATDFVVVCFGFKWHESGLVMTMLALLGAAATLNMFSPSALVAMGRTRLVFYQAVFDLATNVILALIGAQFGVVAVAAGFAARAYIVNPFVLWMLKKGIGLSPREALRGVLPPVIAAASMAAILTGVRYEALMGISPIYRLAVMVPLGVVLYGAVLMLFGRAYLSEIVSEIAPLGQLVRGRFKRSGRTQ